MCRSNTLEIIAQIEDADRKMVKKLYSCPKCHSTYIKEKKNVYRKLTPKYFLENF